MCVASILTSQKRDWLELHCLSCLSIPLIFWAVYFLCVLLNSKQNGWRPSWLKLTHTWPIQFKFIFIDTVSVTAKTVSRYCRETQSLIPKPANIVRNSILRGRNLEQDKTGGGKLFVFYSFSAFLTTTPLVSVQKKLLQAAEIVDEAKSKLMYQKISRGCTDYKTSLVN